MELLLLFSGTLGGVRMYSDYTSFLNNDKKHRLDYVRRTRGNDAVKPKIIKLIPGYFPEKLESVSYSEDGSNEYFVIDSMGIVPHERQYETDVMPDSSTTKESLFRALFRIPDNDEYRIGGQSSEGHCVVLSAKKIIEFSINTIISEADVAQGIDYNNDKDGSPNVPAIVDYINKNIVDFGLKAEYFLNPRMDDIIKIIHSGGRVMVNITGKAGDPHRVVGYDTEEDEDGDMFIIIHDSGKTYFDKDGRYVKTAAESRKVYEKYVSGAKRKIPIEIFQDMMDAGLTGNVSGSGVRRAAGINTVGIAVYNPGCFTPEYLDSLFSFSRSPMDQVLKTVVNMYTRSREHPYEKYILKYTVMLFLLCWIVSLGLRTYKVVAGNISKRDSSSSPEETNL